MQSAQAQQWRLDLARAEQHITQGAEQIVRQRKLIAELRQDHHVTGLAEDLLGALLESQALHEQHRARLLRQIES